MGAATSSGADAPWDTCELEHPAPLGKASTVRLVGHDWSSHQLLTMVAAIVLSRLHSFHVEIVSLDTGVSTYEALASGVAHADVEAWPRSQPALYKHYVHLEHSVRTLGSTGYTGRSGLYMTPSLVNGSLHHSWHHLRDTGVSSTLPTFGGGDGDGDEPYVPPSAPCADTDRGCGRLWHLRPEYDAGIVEGIVNELGHGNLSVAYLGDEYDQTVSERVERGEPTLVYSWVPARLTSRFSRDELVRVSLPEYGRGCDHADADGSSPQESRVACDFPAQHLLKLGSHGFERSHGEAAGLIAQIELSEAQMNALLRALDEEADATPASVACAWLQANEPVWRAWVHGSDADDRAARTAVVSVLSGLCGVVMMYIFFAERRRHAQHAALRSMAQKRWQRSLRRVLSVNRLRAASEAFPAAGSPSTPAGGGAPGDAARPASACVRHTQQQQPGVAAGGACDSPLQRSTAPSDDEVPRPCGDTDALFDAPPRPAETQAGLSLARAEHPALPVTGRDEPTPPLSSTGRASTDGTLNAANAARMRVHYIPSLCKRGVSCDAPQRSASDGTGAAPARRKSVAAALESVDEVIQSADPSKRRALLHTVRTVASLAGLGAALGIAIAYYTSAERWSALDTVYFAVTIFTTVGYGDIVPSTPGARLFTTFFAMGSMVAVGYSLLVFVGVIMDAQAAANAHLIAASVKSLDVISARRGRSGSAAGQPAAMDADGSATVAARTASSSQSGTAARAPRTPKGAGFVVETPFEFSLSLLRMSLPIWVCLLLGVLLGIVVEGWLATDALYYAVMTVTTVGFGDFAPSSQLGRALACVYLPMSVTAVAKAVQDVSAHASTQWTLRRCSTIERLLRGSNKSSLTKDEFVEHVLVRLYAIDEGTVEAIKAHFHRLDRDGSGTISLADLYVPDEAPPPLFPELRAPRLSWPTGTAPIASPTLRGRLGGGTARTVAPEPASARQDARGATADVEAGPLTGR